MMGVYNSFNKPELIVELKHEEFLDKTWVAVWVAILVAVVSFMLIPALLILFYGLNVCVHLKLSLHSNSQWDATKEEYFGSSGVMMRAPWIRLVP